jgi:hypothetical protein
MCVLNRTALQGNGYQAHQHGKWNPRPRTPAFGLTSPVGRGSVERFRSAYVRRNGWRACEWVNTSREQVSVPSTRFNRSQFPVLHFGRRPSGGWGLSLRVAEDR